MMTTVYLCTVTHWMRPKMMHSQFSNDTETFGHTHGFDFSSDLSGTDLINNSIWGFSIADIPVLAALGLRCYISFYFLSADMNTV